MAFQLKKLRMPMLQTRPDANLGGPWGSPERALWLGVLNQAIRDAQGGWSGGDKNVKAVVEGWVGSGDFYTVCRLAGADPEKMETKFRRLIADKENEDAERID